MKTLARTLILIATCLSLNVAAPVSAETPAKAPKADAVEIGCALRLERNADGSITETCR